MKKAMYTVTAVALLCTGIFLWLYACFNKAVYFSACITAATVSYHLLMRLIVGGICNVCFPKEVQAEHWWFRQKAWEKTVYQKLRLKRWKGMIPTFDQREFAISCVPLKTVVRNMCKAEVCHEIIIVLSFVPLCFAIFAGEFMVFLLTSVLSALYDLQFVLLQRYNRQRLIHVLQMK